METVEKYIDVNSPVRTVYNQWTQFEEFPKFMENIESVEQLTKPVFIGWRKSPALRSSGMPRFSNKFPTKESFGMAPMVLCATGPSRFNPVNEDITRVTLRIDYEPETFLEEAGDKLGIVSSRVQGDLQRFKEFIEARGAETGAWRGKI